MIEARIQVRRAAERFLGGDAEAGISTRHAFSFSGFYDPDNVRFGPLSACNEELLAPGAGFAEHPHRDVEIVTWVVEGELVHEDSAGHVEAVRPGDVQWLSAGEGVRHVERNGGAGPLRFVQMWLTPLEAGGSPAYGVSRSVPDGEVCALPRAGAVLHVRRPGAGERCALPGAQWLYVHVVRGGAALGGVDSCRGGLGAGPGRDVARRGGAGRGRGAVAVGDAGGGAFSLRWGGGLPRSRPFTVSLRSARVSSSAGRAEISPSGA